MSDEYPSTEVGADGPLDGPVFAVPGRDTPATADELLALALSRPTEALAVARAILATGPDPLRASVAHQVAGIVSRDFGDIDEAVAELRLALAAARRARAPQRLADVRGSLGVAHAMAGRTAVGLRELDRALASRTDDVGRGRDLIRRAHVLWLLGRGHESLRDADGAVAALAGSGDAVWHARALTHRAMAHLAIGALVSAEHDYRRAEALFERAGQRLEFADARQERAAVAFARGDLPEALARLDEAEQLVAALGVFEPELHITRCAVLLTAGLVAEARDEIEAALARSLRQRGSATRRAELLHVAAQTARAGGDHERAAELSRQALSLFRGQRRPGWAARAQLVLLQSRYERGETSGSLLSAAVRLAGRLDGLDSSRAAEGHLLAGRIALARRDGARARGELAAAARTRGGDLHAGIAGHVARALLHAHDGRTRQMLATCERGLRMIDLHLRRLGATELRAEATALGSELAAIALRHAARRSDGRQMLSWSERWRSIALTVPPVRPPADSVLISELAALRTLSRRMELGASTPALVQERRRREEGVRRLVRQTPAAASDPRRLAPPAALHAALGDGILVELIDLDGQLRAVVVHGGRLRTVTVGSSAAADRAVQHALFALRRAAVRPDGEQLDLGAIGIRMERALVGDILTGVPDGVPLVIVPTGRWHAVPWGLMPGVRCRAVAVAPSATAWLRARSVREPGQRRVVIIGGPGLTTGTREVRELRRRHPRAVTLAGSEATVGRVLAAMDGAWLVHIAAHGRFRADSPLFSAVELADGPLTVYDLERLGVAPYRVILSSCDSARGRRSGADEMLGLVSALTNLGSAGVLGSVVPVDDPATVALMVRVHEGLLAGRDLARALAGARADVSGDAHAGVAADSFIALGV